MKLFKIIFCCLMLLVNLNFTHAQVIDLSWNDYSIGNPNFKTDYIKKNNIKEIKITYQYKPLNERIFDKGICQKTIYNKDGYPEKTVTTVKTAKQQTESLFTWYIYAKPNIIRVKRTFDKNGYYSEYFDHDPAGYLTKYSKVKEQNINENPLMFKPGYQEVKWAESYKYEFFGKESYKRTCINDINQPYKQQVFSLNNMGLKRAVYTTFVITTTGSDEEIKYNELGQITEKKYFANTGNYFSESYKYEYKNNILDKEYYFINSKQSYEKFFFYNEKGLLESDLKKLPDASMDISKYEYSFY